MGVNGLDVTSLRPFDLVIPFTIKKGEITGEWERKELGSHRGQHLPAGTLTLASLPHRGGEDALGQGGAASHN